MSRILFLLSLTFAALMPLEYVIARHAGLLPNGLQWTVIGTSLVLCALFTLAFAPPRSLSLRAWLVQLRERLDGPPPVRPLPGPVPQEGEAPAAGESPSDFAFPPPPLPALRLPSTEVLLEELEPVEPPTVAVAAVRPSRPPPFVATAPLLPVAEATQPHVVLQELRLTPPPAAPALPTITPALPDVSDSPTVRQLPLAGLPPAIAPVKFSEALAGPTRAPAPPAAYKDSYQAADGRAPTRVLPSASKPKKPSRP
jgi:hypothetical protein